MARTAGVNLSQVSGTGPNGRVRPVDISAAAVKVSEVGTEDVTTYVVELDLTSVADGGRSRAAILGAVAYALLIAVRRVNPVTDVEIVSPAGTGTIARAHDLSQAALISRIEAGPVTSATTSAQAIAIIDAEDADSIFTIARCAPDRLLSATVGQVEPRPVIRPGRTGYPDISFRIAAFLSVSCRTANFDASTVTGILSTTATLLHDHVREIGTSS